MQIIKINKIDIPEEANRYQPSSYPCKGAFIVEGDADWIYFNDGNYVGTFNLDMVELSEMPDAEKEGKQ